MQAGETHASLKQTKIPLINLILFFTWICSETILHFSISDTFDVITY